MTQMSDNVVFTMYNYCVRDFAYPGPHRQTILISRCEILLSAVTLAGQVKLT